MACHPSRSQLLPPGAAGCGLAAGSPVTQPAHPAALTSSTLWGTRTHRQHSEAGRPPYLSALNQQVLEGIPELSAEDLLQLPGQYLSWFAGALSREEAEAGLRGCAETHLHWPPAQRGQPASPTEPQADEGLAAWLSRDCSDAAQSPLPASAWDGVGLSQAKGTTSEGCTRAPGPLSGAHKVTSTLPPTCPPAGGHVFVVCIPQMPSPTSAPPGWAPGHSQCPLSRGPGS